MFFGLVCLKSDVLSCGMCSLVTSHVMCFFSPYTRAAHVCGGHWLHYWTPEDLPVLLPDTQAEGNTVLLWRHPGGAGGMAPGGNVAGDVWSIPAVWVRGGRGMWRWEGHVEVGGACGGGRGMWEGEELVNISTHISSFPL